MASTGVAPVCNSVPLPEQFTTKPPQVPSFSVPKANDPASLIMAILELQLALTAITGPPPLNNKSNGPNTFSATNQSNSVHSETKDSKSKHSSFKEASRTTQLVKVVNPDDPTQYVIIKRITQLQFQNAVTKQKIKWQLNNPNTTSNS